MADKKAQRLFLRLISETFFVSDDTLDSKKIDRLVKRLDRLDPIPSSASSAEEALQHWYHTQGIEPPSVELERPRFCSAKKRGKHIWKTIVAPAAILLTLFLVIWVPTNFQQSKTDSAMPNRTAEGEQNAAPQQYNEVGFDNAQSAESKLAAGESQDEEPASQYSGAMEYSRLFNSVDMSLPMGEWLKLKMDAGEPLAVTGTVTHVASDSATMSFVLHTEQGNLGLLLSSALFVPETILHRQVCVWIREDAYAPTSNLGFSEEEMASLNVEPIEVDSQAPFDSANLAVFLVDEVGNLQAVYEDDSLEGEFPQTVEMWNSQVGGE